MTINTTTARALGAIAYNTGCPYAPALDENMVAHIAGREVGDPRTQPELKAWLDGWTGANLRQFAEEFPGQNAIADFAKATKGFGHCTII